MSMFTSMQKYMEKAVRAREDVYQGDLEAESRTVNKGNIVQARAAAVQNWRGSAKCKELVEANKWHMQQAIMFGIASIAQNMCVLTAEIVRIRKSLEEKK